MKWRRWIGYALMAVVGLAGILALLEVRRKQSIVPISARALADDSQPNTELEKTINPKELEERYQNPEQFDQLIEDLREQVATISRREESLEHMEITLVEDVDAQGKAQAGEKHTERVWHENGQKFRQTVEQIDLKTGKSKWGMNRKVRKDTGKVNEIFPFVLAKADDDYEYTLAGIEPVGDSWGVKIAYKPGGDVKGRFEGECWADAITHEPIRLYAVLAEKKPFLDQLSMLIEYGVVDTGERQVVRSVIDGSGGFALLQKHIRSEIVMRDYRPVGADQKSAESTNE